MFNQNQSPQPLMSLQQNYPQNYQAFPVQNQYVPPTPEPVNQFTNQNFNHPVYDQFDNPNHFPSNQYPPNQFQQNQPPFNQSNFNSNYPSQNFEQPPPVHYEEQNPNQFNNRNHQFTNNPRMSQEQVRINRPQKFKSTQRSPPKRRGFENNQAVGDMPKKKRRSMELANLHEVPTIDMPDSTITEVSPITNETTIFKAIKYFFRINKLIIT